MAMQLQHQKSSAFGTQYIWILCLLFSGFRICRFATWEVSAVKGILSKAH